MTYQISMFEQQEPDLFTSVIQHGSNICDSRKRIVQAVMNCSKKDLVVFLKKEYGIVGWSGPGLPSVWFDSRGLFVDPHTDEKQKYTWEQVADKVIELVATGRY